MNFRIGHGYDVHRLESNEKFTIGGIEIKHYKGVIGHSDADVVIHALCDAMLGAFSIRTSQYNDTPDEVLSEVNNLPRFIPQREDKNNIKTNIKKALKKSNIPQDMLWVLK